MVRRIWWSRKRFVSEKTGLGSISQEEGSILEWGGSMVKEKDSPHRGSLISRELRYRIGNKQKRKNSKPDYVRSMKNSGFRKKELVIFDREKKRLLR